MGDPRVAAGYQGLPGSLGLPFGDCRRGFGGGARGARGATLRAWPMNWRALFCQE